MKKFMVGALALFAVAVSAAEVLKWNAENSFSGWRNPAGMTMSIENGVLVLDVTKPDSSMMNLQVNLPPSGMGALEIDYRATGFPKTNHGEFYYAGNSNSWSEKRVWRHYNIQTDGQWHTLRLDGHRFDRSALEECGSVTKLRLDMVNQAPGRIEIKEIRLIPVEKAYVWNATNNFFGWERPSNMKMTRENGLLVLDITARDCNMINLTARIPAKEFDTLEVDYRATGLPMKNQGEFYYADNATGWSEKRVWRHWNPVVDGEWHTLKYKGKNFDTAAWNNMGIITKLRLDLVNNAPGKIEIREIRFTKSAQ